MSGAKTASNKAGKSRQHHCTEHGEVAVPTKHWPGNKIRFDCPKGCSLTKQQTVKGE